MVLEEILEDEEPLMHIVEREPEITAADLSSYFEEHIQNVQMNRVRDGDREVVEQRKVWLQIVPEKVRLQAEQATKIKRESRSRGNSINNSA